jgi:hypothetical protein
MLEANGRGCGAPPGDRQQFLGEFFRQVHHHILIAYHALDTNPEPLFSRSLVERFGLEDDGFVVIRQYPVLDVPVHSPRKHPFYRDRAAPSPRSLRAHLGERFVPHIDQ